jgi:hypothetical protein
MAVALVEFGELILELVLLLAVVVVAVQKVKMVPQELQVKDIPAEIVPHLQLLLAEAVLEAQAPTVVVKPVVLAE